MAVKRAENRSIDSHSQAQLRIGDPIISCKLSIGTLHLSRNHVATAKAAITTGNNRCFVRLLTTSQDASKTGAPNRKYRTNGNRKIVKRMALLANNSRTLYGTDSINLKDKDKAATMISSIKKDSAVLYSMSRPFVNNQD
ncbi:MAG: hypothetical protein JRE64_14415 [Deltaproteobacteria bacterium]|nr:hypothetical protein [Deltaproteobacteria bacterium]